MDKKILLGKNVVELGTYTMTLGYSTGHGNGEEILDYRIGYLNVDGETLGDLSPTVINGADIRALCYQINEDAYGDGGHFGVRLDDQLEGVDKLFLKIKDQDEVFILRPPGEDSNAVYPGYYCYNGPLNDYEEGETIEFTLSVEYPESMMRTVTLGAFGGVEDGFGYLSSSGIGAMNNTSFSGANVRYFQLGWVSWFDEDGESLPYRGPIGRLDFDGELSRDYYGISLYYDDDVDSYGLVAGATYAYEGDGVPTIEYEEGKVIQIGMRGVDPTRKFACGTIYVPSNTHMNPDNDQGVYRDGDLVQKLPLEAFLVARVMAGDEIWIISPGAEYMYSIKGISFGTSRTEYINDKLYTVFPVQSVGEGFAIELDTPY